MIILSKTFLLTCKIIAVVMVPLTTVSCEQTFNIESPAAPSPTPPASNTTITNTNNNNNTNNNDKTGSDTGPTNPNSPNDPGGSVIPLPSYGEATVKSVATNNPTLLANSCQDRFGESAWAFLDLAIRTLQLQDSRWGYLCKDSTCIHKAKDIVAYRASSGYLGIWIVDVIGNHCPAPSDVVTVTWQTLPFETTRPWSASR